MEELMSSAQLQRRSEVAAFLTGKRVETGVVGRMLSRCMHLQVASVDKRLWPNWEFLEERVGFPMQKLPMVVAHCPQLLVFSIFRKLEPTAACLEALGAQGKELATVVTRFPQILVHCVEEKVVLCTCIP
ncbi:unnamed protein product [Sphagnum jensenii]|uniref:Uncharacterized protein n=1 Tax=Sphagnum jensenii TaxID=128206 RepID=A0ABP0W991_9BRYO